MIRAGNPRGLRAERFAVQLDRFDVPDYFEHRARSSQNVRPTYNLDPRHDPTAFDGR